MSNQGTPFIPPLSPPRDRSPIIRLPVIPSPAQYSDAPLPGWTTQPQSPASGYPQMYLNSPYGGSPFIPSGYPSPAMPPGSYFPPPAPLPYPAQGQPPPGPPGPGFSHDWVAYGMAAAAAAQGGPTPWGAPPPGLHPAAAAYGGATPWGPPQGPPPGTPWAPPGTAYIPFQNPLPGAGFAGGMPPGMGWGPPIGGTPFAHPMTPAWAPAAMQGGAPPPPREEQPAPSHLMEDRQVPRDGSTLISRFAVGKHYGPVLTPFIAGVVDARIELNPILLPKGDFGTDYLIWNMLFTNAYCRRSTDSGARSFLRGRELPATVPRLSTIRLVIRGLPWVVDVKASDDSTGVTCGDIIDRLDDFLHRSVSTSDNIKLSQATQQEYLRSYYYNRSAHDDVPGGRLGKPMVKVDWLGERTEFGGIEIDHAYVKQFCGDVLPCTFVLKCDRRFRPTEEEMHEHAQLELVEHERPRSRASRPRSRAGNET